MKKLWLLAAVLLASVTFSYAQFTFTSIDYPDGVGTRTRGINNHGQIVGSYDTEDGNRHALLIEKGKFIPLAPTTILGTAFSDAFKINDRGDVVGWVCPDICHAFLLTKKGVLTTLDFPGGSAYTSTVGWDVNESGTVVGVYDSFDGDFNLLYEGGFTWKDGNFIDVVFPGAGDSAVTGINARGEFVGSWDRGLFTTTSGFVFSKGEFTSFDAFVPELTQPSGINAHSDIVGQWYENGVAHGFLKIGAVFTEIIYPGAAVTTAWGINNRGQMVGNWLDSSNVVHGWLAQVSGK